MTTEIAAVTALPRIRGCSPELVGCARCSSSVACAYFCPAGSAANRQHPICLCCFVARPRCSRCCQWSCLCVAVRGTRTCRTAMSVVSLHPQHTSHTHDIKTQRTTTKLNRSCLTSLCNFLLVAVGVWFAVSSSSALVVLGRAAAGGHALSVRRHAGNHETFACICHHVCEKPFRARQQ